MPTSLATKGEKETVFVQGKGCCWAKAPMPVVTWPTKDSNGHTCTQRD